MLFTTLRQFLESVPKNPPFHPIRKARQQIPQLELLNNILVLACGAESNAVRDFALKWRAPSVSTLRPGRLPLTDDAVT